MADVVLCDPPFSFFQEADKYERPQHNHALHRAFSLARKLRARTIVREDISADAWIAQENDAISAAIGRGCRTRAWCLSFFSEPFTDECAINTAPPESYAGYLVVVRTKPRGKPATVFVHSAVLEAPVLLNNYIHCSRKFRGRVGERDFWVRGSYFCQQNGITGTCGHAALRTVLTDLAPMRRLAVTDHDINRTLRLTPGRNSLALTDMQIVHVLEAYGFRSICHDFFQDPVVEYAEFVHPFLESGFPALLVFRLEDARIGHVVAVIGHTLNTDLWYPEARLGYPLTFPSRKYSGVSASYWVDNLIVQDDNYGMYTCLSTRCLSKITLPHRDPRSRVDYGFGILANRVGRRPVNAYYNAVVALTEELLRLREPIMPRWLRELREAVGSERRAPVFRTVLLSRQQYVKHSETLHDWSNGRLTQRQQTLLRDGLPPRFWMVEVSLPNLFTANKRKLGELLFDVRTPRRRDPLLGCWVGGRLPGVFYVPAATRDTVPVPEPSAIEGHVELYRGARPWPRPPEW